MLGSSRKKSKSNGCSSCILLTSCRAEPEVKDWVQVLTQRYAGMKIVVGRDKLDEIQVYLTVRFVFCNIVLTISQGVRQKIQAFEYFLDKYPEFQGKVCTPLLSEPLLTQYA